MFNVVRTIGFSCGLALPHESEYTSLDVTIRTCDTCESPRRGPASQCVANLIPAPSEVGEEAICTGIVEAAELRYRGQPFTKDLAGPRP
jgi:hypothetical protein